MIGLVGVLLSGLGMLRDLNCEVASALNPATATPTPLIMAVVLPEETYASLTVFRLAAASPSGSALSILADYEALVAHSFR